jgi:hypothetical protein
VERLVQRLVCGAAMLDPRFSSKFLATLDGIRDRSTVSSSLQLHTPTHYGGGSHSPKAKELVRVQKILQLLGKINK